MTVEQLIEKLKKCPKNAEIMIDYINESTDYWGSDEEKEEDVEAILLYDWGENSEVHICTYKDKYNKEFLLS